MEDVLDVDDDDLIDDVIMLFILFLELVVVCCMMNFLFLGVGLQVFFRCVLFIFIIYGMCRQRLVEGGGGLVFFFVFFCFYGIQYKNLS